MSDSFKHPEIPSSGIMASLEPGNRRLLGNYGEFLPAHPGQVLISEGNEQDSLYFVISGLLHVHTDTKERRILIAEVGAGQVLGEVNLFDPAVASASVTAKQFSQIWKANRDDLDQYAKAYPEAGVVLMKGILSGISILLAIVAVVLLFWNEGRSVKTYKSLKEGSSAVVSISAEDVDPANDGKLVHLTGQIETSGVLEDAIFGVTSEGIRLIRTVEMYLWDEEKKSETKKKLGGGTETVTTYTPVKKWSSSLIDSNSFHKENKNNSNPESMPYKSQNLSVSEAKLGAFDLPKSLFSQVKQSKPSPSPTTPNSRRN